MKSTIDLQIAIAASTAEMKFQRIIGASPLDQFLSSFEVLDEIIAIAGRPDKPTVFMPMRKIGRAPA